MPWWEAEEQQRLLEAARHAAVDQPPDARPTAQVPPTPAPQKTVPPAMTADEVAQFLCYRITDDQKDVSRAFKFYDKDGGGTIDRKEFRHFLEDRYLLRLNDYEFHKFYKFVDTDGTGVVDFREFLAFFNRKQKDPRVWGLGDSGYNIKVNEDMLLEADKGSLFLPTPPTSRGSTASSRPDVGATGTAAATSGRPRTGSLRSRRSQR